MTRRTTLKLPTPTWGGLSQREHAINQAREWQIANATRNTMVNGVWIPTKAYLVVRDLLIALEDAPVKRKRAIERRKR